MDKFEIGKKYMCKKDERLSEGVIEIISKDCNKYRYKIICGMKNIDNRGYFEIGSYLFDHLIPYEEGKISFTKADLHNGDVVVRRNGSVEIACPETGTVICKNGFNNLSSINDDLTYNGYGDNESDIIKVYRPKESWQCQFDESMYVKGDLVFDRERDIKPKFDCQRWIDDMFNRYTNDKNVQWRSLTEKTIIVYNTQNPNKNGFAVCKDGDIFDLEIGIAVAYAKYLGEPIPKEI